VRETCNVPASGDFKLSISKALTDQLHEALHALTPAPLTEQNLADVEARQGVYQLYLGNDLVYVGSASGSLRSRLSQHLRKLSGRQNIAAASVHFTCLYVDEDLTVLAPEDRLIRVFQDEGSCVWNGSGFGIHDPGRRRDETAVDAGHFDAQYPIRLDWTTAIPADSYTVADLLRRLQRDLPYTFRFQNDAAARADYAAVEIEVPADNLSALDLFKLIAAALPSYQITALPGYAIMYRESRDYPQATIIQP
jgi:hypothetical protein